MPYGLVTGKSEMVRYGADTSLGEDTCTVRVGARPNILSILRPTIISLMYHSGYRVMASSVRRFSRRSHEVLALVHSEEADDARALRQPVGRSRSFGLLIH